jgi:hypothetical protein
LGDVIDDKHRTGRPRKAEDEARCVRLASPRLTHAEALFIQENAARAGLSVAEYSRRVLNRSKVTPAITDVDEAALAELARIGVNLNQMAKRINAGGIIPPLLADALAEVRVAVQRIAERGE